MILHISPYKYNIELTDKNIYSSNSNKKIPGQVIHPEDKILIDKRLSDQKQNNVLLHEVLHVILSVNGLLKGLSKEDKEHFIGRFSPLLHQFIKDNPEFIQRFYAKSKTK